MSHREDQGLREAFGSSSLVEGDGERCPAPDRLEMSARGLLSAPEQENVILHLSACGACAAAWRVARELAPPVRRARWAIPVLAAAAAVVLSASAGIWLLRQDAPAPPPTFRNQGGSWLASRMEGRTLPREQFTLRWAPGPEGTAYDLRVLTENLDVLHRAGGLEEAAHTVPRAALETLPAGAPVFWQVTARLPDGSATVSSTFLNRVE